MRASSAADPTRDAATTGAATVLIVPGLRDHVEEHWQTHLERALTKVACVPRLARDKLSRAVWVAALQRSLAAIDGPVILAAHSAGVMIVAHWARHHRRPIQGALLATPPDFECPLPAGYPTPPILEQNGWLPTPRDPLPFPSIVAASTNDPLARFDVVTSLAKSWGSRVVNLGAVGHLNPAAGYGKWPLALTLLDQLRQTPH